MATLRESVHILKRLLVIAATTAIVLFPASGALAEGAGAISVTQAFHNATDSFASPNPCTGASGTVSLVYNGSAHFTFLTSGIGAGTGWGTFTAAGTFSFVPNDPSQPSYTGQFMNWDGENLNLKNYTATSTQMIHGTGSDGSTIMFHEVAHITVSATGVTTAFDKPTCN